MKRGLREAILYLLRYPGATLVPDDIKKYANLDIMASTLAHSLRRAARDGAVEVVYKEDSVGRMIARYRAVPGYKPASRPAKAHRKGLDRAKAVFFYSLYASTPNITSTGPGFRPRWNGRSQSKARTCWIWSKRNYETLPQMLPLP